ncbi:peptidyl-prolyl cis-trans isomerase FKBP16-4, chloroplastic-like [Lycium barbarum]|uniref:peptidyl-prolyl cis-trans isomerase FKBP16-4, chloroplastic-like n=1 Tax=Lycium barbarum TaxID=112863 RepID=UPI00293F509C|nr:peptidyl-prolyl cis-trans isomerase FKBP16-4, chloroplastic-like [Lycium barbarum]
MTSLTVIQEEERTKEEQKITDLEKEELLRSEEHIQRTEQGEVKDENDQEMKHTHIGFQKMETKFQIDLDQKCPICEHEDLPTAAFCLCDVAGATSTSRRALRGAKIPKSEYTTLLNGLKYYDLKVGTGAEAVKGSRVAVHYVAKWRNITFMTSRQGMGVGGGTPYGFDVGQSERGNVLKGLDLGVQGMRVGGQRLLIVPPELAYGKKGVQEIPPNATIEMDIELLSIKQSPFGTPVKVVEG